MPDVHDNSALVVAEGEALPDHPAVAEPSINSAPRQSPTISVVIPPLGNPPVWSHAENAGAQSAGSWGAFVKNIVAHPDFLPVTE